ncbi:MAG: hypothetical protein JNK64_24135 [Myxococcales bacterium]|nr:hypothetical protein [Myxococcales bacterium]
MKIRIRAVPAKPTRRAATERTPAGSAKASEKSTAPTPKPPAGKKKPLITLKAAIAEFGEELGPILARLINSPNRKPRSDARTRLSDVLTAWAEAERVIASYQVFGAPPQAGTLQLALQDARKHAEAGRWAILVFPPGKLDPVLVPDNAPASGCPIGDLVTFGLSFKAMRYWGDSAACEEIDRRMRRHWTRYAAVPEVPTDELRTSLYVASYSWKLLGETSKSDEAYLRDLHATLVARLGTRA